MRRILLFFITISISLEIFASADRLVYKKDTLELLTEPRFSQGYYDSIRSKVYEDSCMMKTRCFGCVGNSTEWTIIENKLYLTGFGYTCHTQEEMQTRLKELYGSKCVDGRVKADWFTGEIFCAFGKYIGYIPTTKNAIYEKELVLIFREGNLISESVCDNSKAKSSDFRRKEKEFLEWINNQINWDIIPKMDSPVRVNIAFSADEDGTVSNNVRIEKGDNELFNKEALRVIKLIPEWDVYFFHGVHQRQYWHMVVFFKEENRRSKKI